MPLARVQVGDGGGGRVLRAARVLPHVPREDQVCGTSAAGENGSPAVHVRWLKQEHGAGAPRELCLWLAGVHSQWTASHSISFFPF